MFLADLDKDILVRKPWVSPVDFILACLSYTIGFGNLLKFPHMCLKNGGVVFLIQYLCILILLGIPLFFLEVCLGQFSSSGPAECWKFGRIFKGIGLAMFLLSVYMSIYYNMYLAYSFYYLLASLTSQLPWSTCMPEWSSPWCWTNLPVYNKSHCLELGLFVEANGTCYSPTGHLVAIYDEPLARFFNIKKMLPSTEFFHNEVLGKVSRQLFNIGLPRWQLAMCYIFSWMCVIIKVINPTKQSVNTSRLRILIPFVILIMVLVRSLLLPGQSGGISLFMAADYMLLTEVDGYIDAAFDIFFTLSLSLGGLMTLARNNDTANDAFRDSIIVTFANFATSIVATLMTISVSGFLSRVLVIRSDEGLSADVSLLFDLYPFAITKLPLSVFWSIMFFFMLIMFGLNNQFVLVETCLLFIMDKFPKTRDRKVTFVIVFCCMLCLLGLPLATNGGVRLLNVIHAYAGGWSVMIIALIECLAISCVYGLDRFLSDIELMMGYKFCFCIPSSVIGFYSITTMGILIPLFITGVLIYSLYSYDKYHDSSDRSDVLGWLLVFSTIPAMVVPAVHFLYTANGNFISRVYKGTLPTYEWGPVAVVLEYMHMAEEGIPETELRGVTNPIMQMSTGNLSGVKQEQNATQSKC